MKLHLIGTENERRLLSIGVELLAVKKRHFASAACIIGGWRTQLAGGQSSLVLYKVITAVIYKQFLLKIIIAIGQFQIINNYFHRLSLWL